MSNQDRVVPDFDLEPDFIVERIDLCVIRVSPTRHVAVTEEHALAILERSFQLTGHRPYVMLIDMGLVNDVSPTARRVLMSARHIRAAAMLGRTPMDRMLAAPYEDAVYPAKYFTDKQTAGQWLKLIHDLVCEDPIEHTISLTVDLEPLKAWPRPRRTRY
ncbi:hypothetical protein D6T63_18295 [Arthrobacter cheniae]|uniref:DUF7793 domain-containing protein n=1 Tax=Arthrobacter cheniae TaxID=1258888 RepID=A0A3A5M164_9MICC|nr:hypothetical protein [Arthrobacter cheniae]RJT74872.1 hypothetical protein D6T63_18295 [Arthrobacter cheniae]